MFLVHGPQKAPPRGFRATAQVIAKEATPQISRKSTKNKMRMYIHTMQGHTAVKDVNINYNADDAEGHDEG